MLARIAETFTNCFKIPELKSRIFFTLLLLAICRMAAIIPLPGLDGAALKAFFESNAAKGGSSLLGLYSLFTGGAMEHCALGALGIMPYISATIIVQLLTAVIPQLSKLAREEGGRTKIIQYGRYLTLLLCLGQGFVMAIAWENPDSFFRATFPGKLVLIEPIWWYRIQTTLLLTAGTLLLMWLGEQISERGIGNGVSLVITIGILARLPAAGQAFIDMYLPAAGETKYNVFHAIFMIVLLLAVVAGVIAVTQAQRKIPVQYAQRTIGRRAYAGTSSFMPLRVNYSGVMPIIFAQAILMFPQKIFLFLEGSTKVAFFGQIARLLNEGAFLYMALYAAMILFFSYFWVATQFNELQIADDLKKYGGYIPGVRPGPATSTFLHNAMSRITLAGAVFLTVIAIIPIWMNRWLEIPYYAASFFGGTSLLILVGVVLDTMRQVESHLLMRHYDGFLKKGRMRGRF
ncbi:MAG TPA: preprotein translocase subunit SecY [Candidatus Paceibacterota bacterium]|nr:preprotein translocase subunit SecY [Verrucomicrobiota bacterium]HRY47244.1 preprotein translocase subunit SecY [Candidatus Paceibacterota bacterium]HSA02290.1 preprotein translocase subunit SecY [Candidatus Paceibacterota bacterium]